MNPSETKKPILNSILVTGDVTVDNYIYGGEKFVSSADDKRTVKSLTELGGSFLVYKILKEIQKMPESTDLYSIYHDTSFHLKDCSLSVQSSYSLWEPFQNEEEKQLYWRINKALGYGPTIDSKELQSQLKKEKIDLSNKVIPNILVINDSGFSFRNKKNKSLWNLSDKVNWIVLKMTSPLGSGDLWYELIEKHSGKLVLITSTDELRMDGAKIGRGYSWEETVEDILDAIYTLPQFNKLLKCRHLIISCSMEGALWINNEEKKNRETTLIYDTVRGEGEFEQSFQGKTFGYMSCLVAGIVNSIVCNQKDNNLNLFNAIQCGMSAMRNLIDQGHGVLDNSSPSGYPAKRLANQIVNPKYSFSRAYIPFTKPVEKGIKGRWMIVELTQHVDSSTRKISLYGLASQVVLKGVTTLSHVPHARFDKLISVDRQEIETLRRFRRYMIDYNENKKNNYPISFGIFGPPGAGKSFGVKQIANDIFGPKSWLEFNLSRFSSIAELNAAFHQIRDMVLAGITPIAFWDEFDSKNYFWLQYFLVPMQSGTFQEGSLTHTIGKCIFIFAGATSHTFDAFGEFKKEKDRAREFILLKGPDFKSRLDSYYNVLGPNQKVIDSETGKLDPSDITLYLRRAIFISTKINYNSDLPAKIDEGLINALLRISKYEHGARSFDKLLSLLQSADHTDLNQSLIPSKDQLSMYVDADQFEKLMIEKREIIQELPIDGLANAIHESYRKSCKRKREFIADRFNKPFNNLTSEDKEDNRASARRMQEILSLVGLRIIKGRKSVKLARDHEINIMNYLEYHLELLAEAEHNGWMRQRKNAGWQFGEIKNNEKKIHPDLMLYHNLANNVKEKDRDSIRNYYKNLKSAGYMIDWMK